MATEPSHRAWLNGLSTQAQGVLAINVAAVIFGTAALYGKLNVSPFWIVTLRAGFAALTLVLIGAYRKDFQAFGTRSWKALLLSGALLAIHWLTFFVSVQQAGVAVATLTFATFPLFTVIVEAIQAGRLPRLAELAVGVVIVFAVALLVDPSGGQSNVAGAIAGLASGFTYALFWRVGQRIDRSLPPTTIALCQNAVVVALLAPALLVAVPVPASAVDWLSLAALGFFNTAVMLLIYLYALQRISASVCSGFIALEPVYAIAFAAVLFDEPVTPWIVVSIVLIIGASLALLKLDKQVPGAVL